MDLTSASEAETARLGETLALALRRGDLVALSGDLGAGKSVLARATVRAAAGDAAIDVPSPTFTLLQTYDALAFESLAHADLYRIEDAGEVVELGLDDAVEHGAALVEWPEKGEGFLPEPALSVAIEIVSEDERRFTVTGKADALERLTRSIEIRAFLDGSGHASAQREHLTGDASTRAYERIKPSDGDAVILMNAPEQPDGPPVRDGKPYSAIAHLAETVSPFYAVAQLLQDKGLCAPAILAHDLDAGLLLIGDLGSDTMLDDERQPIAERYHAAIETLAQMHMKPWDFETALPDGSRYSVPAYDHEAMAIEVELLAEWYAPYRQGRPLAVAQRDAFDALWADLFKRLDGAEQTLVLRDYHSPNIIWRGEKTGTDRIGIIDFQDSVIGPSAYDVASLAQDARVDVSEELEAELLDHYCDLRGDFDEPAFREAYAIMAAQRATKVLGIFVRLSKRDGKHAYLAHLPRIEAYLRRSLAHPALAAYRAWVDTVLG